MELQTKEITPYLPFKLKCQVKDLGKTIEAELHSVYADGTCTFCDTVESEKGFDWIKPILKPLSVFECDHIIQVKDHLGLGQWCDHYDQYFDAWFDDAESIQKLVLQCPYEIMQFFLECHFDVFGLIKKGLAVECRS
jgi:hypothetical protein